MTIADAVRVLRAHNAGEAIDVLCCFVDSDGESCYLSDGDEG